MKKNKIIREGIKNIIPNEIQISILNTDNSKHERFIVVKGSLSSHCCFEYSIVDTLAGKEDYGDYWKLIMCECFEEKEANIICEALNKCNNLNKSSK